MMILVQAPEQTMHYILMRKPGYSLHTHKRYQGYKHISKELLKLLAPCHEKNNVLLFGHRGGATMMMAKYASNPFSKLSHFKKGRIMLEKAIASDQQSAELRFLRFTAQTKSPAFLGYNDQIETDKKFLLYSLAKLEDTSLRKAILSYLLSSEYVNPAEKKQLKDERLIDSGG